MSTYFVATIQFKNGQDRCIYDEYIRKVKPIVENYGGVYLVRTEEIEVLSDQWRPDRVIIIQFMNREDLDRCFASGEYRAITDLRMKSVGSKAIIVEGD